MSVRTQIKYKLIVDISMRQEIMHVLYRHQSTKKYYLQKT